jgi:hypothetical protein
MQRYALLATFDPGKSRAHRIHGTYTYYLINNE